MTSFCSIVVSSLDDALLAAHLKRTAKWLQKCDHGGNGIARTQTKGVTLNVYHDPAPQELRRARDVLLAVMSGAEKYLKEWPEHPVLNQVQFILSVACMHTRTHASFTPCPQGILVGLRYICKAVTMVIVHTHTHTRARARTHTHARAHTHTHTHAMHNC